MKVLKRRTDAAGRLAELVKHRADKSFLWGVRDCMLFVADAIEAVTGEDIAKGVRGTYSDQRGSESELLRLSETGDIAEYLENYLAPYEGVIEGDREHGAVCIVEIFGKRYGGVVTSKGVVVFQPSGYIVIDVEKIIKSWGF